MTQFEELFGLSLDQIKRIQSFAKAVVVLDFADTTKKYSNFPKMLTIVRNKYTDPKEREFAILILGEFVSKMEDLQVQLHAMDIVSRLQKDNVEVSFDNIEKVTDWLVATSVDQAARKEATVAQD